MKKILLGLATTLALGAASVSHAADFTPLNCAPGDIHFCVTGDAQAPGVDPVITAFITNTFTAATAIDDTYRFTIDADGIGSGGLQTTFSSATTLLTITDLIINDVSYASLINTTSAGQSVSVNGIPILSGVQNYIRIIGSFNPPAGTPAQANYTGNLTFNMAVPEASTWAMMIIGVGAVGFATRRRRDAKVSYA